jgi:hypothetical protein
MASYADLSRSSRTMSSIASLARESVSDCRRVGSLSSEPKNAATKVGTSSVFGEGSGNIKQSPTDSMKLRASSSVRTALPFTRHFSRRSSISSVSVITSFQLLAPAEVGTVGNAESEPVKGNVYVHTHFLMADG